MSFLHNPRRIRGPASIMKTKPTIFKENATPRFLPRFNAPVRRPPMEHYIVQRGMKTPKIINGRFSNVHPAYERSSYPCNERYATMMDAEDMDNWKMEDIFEIEDDYEETELIDPDMGIMQDVRMQRKNNFNQPERQYIPQKRNMSSYMTPNKENFEDSGNFMKECPTPKRQAVLVPDTPKGLGFKLEKKEKNLADNLKESSPKICPKWNSSNSQSKSKLEIDKNSTFPRIFTVTVDKLKSFRRVLSCGQMIFELYGIADKVFDVKHPKSKTLVLKSQNMKTTLMCNFYEIDRPLPKIVSGQWYRCIVMWRSNNDFQCVSIRTATANELKLMDKFVMTSSKSMAIVLQASNEF